MKDDRLISLNAAIEALKRTEALSRAFGYHAVIDAVEALPSAHPSAEWIERTVSDDAVIEEWQSAKCSACGRYHTTPYMYYFDNHNYCPHCGASMRTHHEG